MIFIENTVKPGLQIRAEIYHALEMLGRTLIEIGPNRVFGDHFIQYDPAQASPRFSIGPDNYVSVEHRGLNLWDICQGSFGYEAPDFYDAPRPEHWAALSRLFNRGAAFIDLCEDVVVRHAPEAFVVWGGMLAEPRAMAAVGARHGLPVFATEFSFDKARIHFDPAGRIGNAFSILQSGPDAARRTLPAAQAEAVHDWVEGNYIGKAALQPAGALSDRMLRFVDAASSPPLLLLGQCAIDTVITYDNPRFSTAAAAYEAVVATCAQDGIPLIVKCHPGDRPKFKDRLKALCDRHENVIFVGGAADENVYRLMDICQAGITINSQAGLEMLAKGKPLLTLGNAFYSTLPACLTLDDVGALPDQIAALRRTESFGLDDHTSTAAFLHHLLFEVLIDVSRGAAGTAAQIVGSLPALRDAPPAPAAPDDDRLRVVIVHPSPSWGGSGYYLQALAEGLRAEGHDTVILSEGSCVPFDRGVRWRTMRFDGAFLDGPTRTFVDDFRPNVLLQVGVRTKPIRAALEIALAHRPLIVVQGEDDEFEPFRKYYPSPHPALLDALDRPILMPHDLDAFLAALNTRHLAAVAMDASHDRWVEPAMRAAMYHLADRYCAIWEPMRDRLTARFAKACDLLPPVVDPDDFVPHPDPVTLRRERLAALDLPDDAVVFFVNGSIYPYSDEFLIFVDALAQLQNETPVPIALLICGNPAGVDMATERLRHFRALDRLGDHAYDEFVQVADVVCAPGVPDTFNRYRLSSRLLKAMAHSKPIFTFKTGFGESLEDDRDGFFTHGADVGEWVDVLRRTLAPETRRAVGVRGRALLESRFDARATATHLAKAWVGHLGRRGGEDAPDGVTGLATRPTLIARFKEIQRAHVPLAARGKPSLGTSWGPQGAMRRFSRGVVLVFGFGPQTAEGQPVPLTNVFLGLSLVPQRTRLDVVLALERTSRAEAVPIIVYDRDGRLNLTDEINGDRRIITFQSQRADFLIHLPTNPLSGKGAPPLRLLDVHAGIVGENAAVETAAEIWGETPAASPPESKAVTPAATPHGPDPKAQTARIKLMKGKIGRLEADLKTTRKHLNAYRNSRTWRVTAWIRKLNARIDGALSKRDRL